ncbi:MAG TPA: hypothetical protein VEX36_10300 [Thermoleophilaceae bacterium]|nr:hypothetical protein [Thermoleophilaceae bacterium]
MLRAIVDSLPATMVGVAVLVGFALLARPSSAVLYAASVVVMGFVVLVDGRYDARSGPGRRL